MNPKVKRWRPEDEQIDRLISVVGYWISSCQFRRRHRGSVAVYLTRDDITRLISMLHTKCSKSPTSKQKGKR